MAHSRVRSHSGIMDCQVCVLASPVQIVSGSSRTKSLPPFRLLPFYEILVYFPWRCAKGHRTLDKVLYPWMVDSKMGTWFATAGWPRISEIQTRLCRQIGTNLRRYSPASSGVK
jgi:hypothetical protein